MMVMMMMMMIMVTMIIKSKYNEPIRILESCLAIMAGSHIVMFIHDYCYDIITS